MKRFLVVVAAFVLIGNSFVFAAGPKEIRIGFTVNDFNDLWVTFMMDAVKKWDERTPGVTVTLGNGQTDVSTQLGIVETWINQGYDAIIVKPVEIEATVAMAKTAKPANIPYFGPESTKEAERRERSKLGSDRRSSDAGSGR
ncbi:MAG: hypothetical protein SAMD01599839_12400 [Rectinema sp.]